MGITWIPEPPPITAAVSGSISAQPGSRTDNTWLDCVKGELIFGEIASTHTNQQYCQISHTCSPPIPTGLTITDTATGIIVSGLTTDLLITIPPNINYTIMQSSYPNEFTSPNETIPTNSVLTHYTPLSTEYELFTITVTAKWTHDNGDESTYVQPWIVRIWNNWVAEKNAVLGLVI